MKVKILTLNYSNALEGFDTSAFDDFIKDKEINEMSGLLASVPSFVPLPPFCLINT